MRFPSRYALRDREGDERTVRKFLWLPRCFGTKEIRWLEYANIRERICKVDVGGSYEWGCFAWKWCEVKFV